MKLTVLALATTLSFSAVHAADMTDPTAPFQLVGNSYYVGLHGVSAVLITSPEGHIRIDASYPKTAAEIEAGIRKQFADLSPFPTVGKTQTLADGETVHVGKLAVTALYTPCKCYVGESRELLKQDLAQEGKAG